MFRLPDEIIIRLARASQFFEVAFLRAISLWQENGGAEPSGTILVGGCPSCMVERHQAMLIDGDCEGEVHAPKNGLIQIHGDLYGTLYLSGISTVIVTGQVHSEARIIADDISHIYVGDSFYGTLQSVSSCQLWVERNLGGFIETGRPSFHARVGGDFSAQIVPKDTAALFWLEVEGFAPFSDILRICERGYTTFEVYLAESDVSPRLFPKRDERPDHWPPRGLVAIAVASHRD